MALFTYNICNRIYLYEKKYIKEKIGYWDIALNISLNITKIINVPINANPM